jgi:hypothetical protein
MNKIQTISFCDSYIEKLAGIIENDYLGTGRDLSRLAIVFGGKRPALFLKRELAGRVRGAFFSPRFMTIDQFMSHIVRQHEERPGATDLNLCYRLYQLARGVVPEIMKGRESFARFLPWTKEIIAFIDQLDLELVEDKALLNIRANAEIGYSVPRDINRLLQSIVTLRQAFRQAQEKESAASRGFIYRRAAELISRTPLGEFDEVMFCNFFYFHAAEEKVVRALHGRGQARLIFQGDERKWPVLRHLSARWATPLREGPEPDPTRFNLKLYSGFDVHSQVGLVREILKTVARPEKAVVVLPDPDHVIPLLSELTSVVGEFNLSMGYPLRRSSLYALLTQVFQAQLSRKQGRYYTRDYLKALRHPFVKNLRLAQDDPAACRVLVNTVEDVLTGQEPSDISGSSFISLEEVQQAADLCSLTRERLAGAGADVSVEDLRRVLGELHRVFFEAWEDVHAFGDLAGALAPLLDLLVEKSAMDRYPLNLNIAQKMRDITEELRRASFREERFPPEDLFRIFDNKISGEIIAFQGSPLKGLQVLGLFETRSLNFDDVIVMDVNEGVLPNLNIYEPLIPREVMISLGLNRLELDEEIQRYLFMRLISSAKNVHLVYQETREKEKSRFVEELIWEREKKQRAPNVVPVTRPVFRVEVNAARRRARKTPEMLEVLRNHRYSASSINLYTRNPMEFYENYVLGLRAREDLLDEPEARQVGTFLHGLLEAAFRPWLGKKPVIDRRFRDRFMDNFNKQFDEVMARSTRSGAFLLKSVMAERLNRFLDNEETSPARQIRELMHLEKRFEDTITLPAGDIRFSYIVDRVDRMSDGTVMIVDYKTGGADLMPGAVDRVLSMDLSREAVVRQVKSFQIPLYYLYLDKQFPGDRINAALYNLRTLDFKTFADEKDGVSRDLARQAFVRALDFIVGEILNPDVDFVDDEI